MYFPKEEIVQYVNNTLRSKSNQLDAQTLSVHITSGIERILDGHSKREVKTKLLNMEYFEYMKFNLEDNEVKTFVKDAAISLRSKYDRQLKMRDIFNCRDESIKNHKAYNKSKEYFKERYDISIF